MIMANYNASNNNQWLVDWFKTHAFTIGERQFTIFWKMCQVIRDFNINMPIFYVL
jgi:hypothetical protein